MSFDTTSFMMLEETTETQEAPSPPNRYTLSFYIKLIILFVGFFADIIFMIYMMTNKIGSRLSTVIIRLQCFEDTFIVFLALIYQLQSENIFITASMGFNEFLCRIWYSQNFYWTCVGISVWNLVWVSLDRFILILFPFRYRRLPKFILPLLVILEIVISGGLNVFSFNVMSRFDNGVCLMADSINDTTVGEHQRIFGIAWEATFWIIPSVLIMVLNFGVIYGLKFRMAESSDSSRDALAMRFTVAAMIISFGFVTCFAVDGYLLLASTLGTSLVNYYGNTLQEIGMFLVTVNFILNPFVFLILMRDFRNCLFRCQMIRSTVSRSGKRKSGTMNVSQTITMTVEQKQME